MDAWPLRASSVWVLSSEALHVSHMCTSYTPCSRTFPISCSSVCTIDRSRRVAKRVPRPSLSFTALIDKPRTGQGWELRYLSSCSALWIRRLEFDATNGQHGLYYNIFCAGMNTPICWLTIDTTRSTSGRTSSDTTRKSSIF